ncbi:MAG: alkaline phosphatase family protein, partial [Gemmatimonadaceae bacterium]
SDLLPRIAVFALAVSVTALLGVVAGVGASNVPPVARAPRLRALLVVIDGLRPDHVTGGAMPALSAIAAQGVSSSAHHAVYPTVTRVNATSLATGMLPRSHGILDNAIYLPAVDSTRALNTGDARAMMRADSALDGRLITAPSIHELLAVRGLRTVVASAGSSGSAYLLAGAGRAPILATELILPAALAPGVHARVGPPPGRGSATSLANNWAVDALLRVGVDSLDVDVGMLWLTDPDHSVHAAGLGSPVADSVIRAVDRAVARLMEGLVTRGLRDRVDVFIVSDHGFSTHAGTGAPFARVLSTFGDQVVVAGSAVYLRPGHHVARAEVVKVLHAAPEVGAVFTAATPGGHTEGSEDGTLSFASVGWEHPRAGDILFSANWSHRRNAAGIAGWTAQAGVAGHGSSSPYDLGATFIAVGPHIKQGVRSRVPSANTDVAPTLLSLLGLPVPRMDGRILTEVMRGGPDPARMTISRTEHHAEARRGAGGPLGYRLTLYTSTVGATRYVDSTITTREP